MVGFQFWPESREKLMLSLGLCSALTPTRTTVVGRSVAETTPVVLPKRGGAEEPSGAGRSRSQWTKPP